MKGRPGLSFHPCRSPQTGSGPLPVQMYLLYCRKALQREDECNFKSPQKQGRLTNTSRQSCDALPRRPSPMKILYRSELHRTTPTNFLYHVRLTYWLPLQPLWAELYLKVKGIQIGSPPEEQNASSTYEYHVYLYVMSFDLVVSSEMVSPQGPQKACVSVYIRNLDVMMICTVYRFIEH